MALSKLESMKLHAHNYINTGKWNEAKNQLNKLCKKFPRDFDAWYLLGAVSGQINDIDMAVRASRKAVGIQPNHAGALYNYGMALSKSGQIEDAIKAYKKSLETSPGNPNTHFNLGNAFKDISSYDNSIKHLKEAISLDPGKANAYFTLGCVYVELGEYAEAKSYLLESSTLDASYKSKADYFIDSFESSRDDESQGKQHVRSLHDQHASYFDQHLINALDYKIPKILFEEYMRIAGEHNSEISILDLGCGTGLCGIEFKGVSKNIVGVDISPKMLEKAAALDIYSELVTDDIFSYLTAAIIKFDLILAADVFIYVGALDEMLPLCANSLSHGGVMAFSIEYIDTENYKLRVSGRYAHSLPYIESTAKLSGFKLISVMDVIVRKEFSRGIPGKVVFLQKL